MPNPLRKTRERFGDALHQLRYSLSLVDALPQLTFLGLLIGLVTGTVIIAFRLAIEWPLAWLLPDGADRFESLEPVARVVLICTGLAVCWMLLRYAGPAGRAVSVGHVLDRLHNHQGHFPSRNIWVQFCGGIICILSGQSVGREGPVIHLGAGISSKLAQRLRLPHNSRYTLIGCGVAAAISASFDTPMAGVIFAMEVILMEYTVVGFVPIIFASVVGTAMSRAVFSQSALHISSGSQLETLFELPFIIASGLAISLAAALFITINIRCLKLNNRPLWSRLTVAAVITSAAAWQMPEVMGLGYDTVVAAIHGNMAVTTLLAIALTKLVVSPAVLGLGVPGGIIGPTLVIGACIGGALGHLAPTFYGTAAPDPGLYVIIGMAGMMAAVLNAPLAALVAVLELSYNPNMIFPSMLVIVIACVSTRHFFRLDGIFIEQLSHTGRALRFRPAREVLKRAGIGAALMSNLVYARRELDYEAAKALLKRTPEWIVIDFTDAQTRDKVALRAADLATFLEDAPVEVLSLEKEVDLLEIPGRRLILSPIHESASLWEALEAIRATGAEGLYAARSNSPLSTSILGILTEESIRNYYQA